ncbi:MAG: hypothetical protein Q9213_007271 [Squamulea squamosa]
MTKQADDSSPSASLANLIISPESRHQALFKNTYTRRGRELDIVVPVYPDSNTQCSFQKKNIDMDLASRQEGKGQPENNFTVLDPAVCLINVCSLQVTMQLRDIDEARRLYDQLIPLAPIMLALTAATTIWSDVLANTDARWNILSQCVDDRTLDEADGISVGSQRNRNLRPRYSSNDLFMSKDPRLLDRYQDVDVAIDDEVKRKLLNSSMDQRLATHFAHLFVRDPLVVFAKDSEADEPQDTSLFEAIQGTTYPTVRFKPPPSLHSDIGWRVEFRPMEVQMTDFENAAFAIFIMLLSRTILYFDLNLHMPISMIDENMENAHTRDAVNCERFHLRSDPLSGAKPTSASTAVEPRVDNTPNSQDSITPISDGIHESPGSEATESSTGADASSSTTSLSSISSDASLPPYCPDNITRSKRSSSDADLAEDQPKKRPHSAAQQPSVSQQKPDPHEEFPLQSISSLINGNPSTGSPGFIPLIKRYLDQTHDLHSGTTARAKINQYLALIAARASGKAWTAAKWQREFVKGHEDYRGEGRC